MNPVRLRAYLLGRLSDAERHEIESRVFEDDDFDSLLQEAEADLLDDWARGRLVPQDADTVPRRFPPEKLRLAKVMAGHTRSVAPGRDRGVRRWLAAAAALCVISGGAYLHRRPVVEMPPPAPVVKRPADGAVQVFALHAPATRGVSVPVFRLSRETVIVRLTVQVAAGSGRHVVELESAGPPIRLEVTPSGGGLSIDIPASQAPAGNCDLLIFEPGGTLLATYAFRIERE